ncbi:MAG TPA: hypothetical protein ENG87_04475 [Candidatus Pacearchaeota archaeon]|nr:hypothetical protein BMS3Abin17_00780 [archaeon BMS3Abin17]HDK42611.1 hypothetical protein [Candidatus Pacearchaeota archaeon]HDZ61465.1 hypothetical protein [Candidatus Pacearchaeota archaeon]
MEKNKKLVIIISVMIIIGLLAYFIPKINPSGKAIKSSNSKPVIVTKENFPVYLENQEIVKDLPKNAVISLRFYNFDSGEREWEESYVIEKESVKKGEIGDADIEIIVHSKYIPQLGNFCSAIQNANKNGDFGYEYNLGKTRLLWKYKSMIRYKDCFGF